MKAPALALTLALTLGAAPAAAQQPDQRGASERETRAMADIVDCMVAGLPDDWRRAAMEINLDQPYDETGSVRYLYTNQEDAPPREPFTPCDVKQPAKTLIGLRKNLPPDRQGWIGAQVTILRDGRFGIRYGFPKKP